MDRIPLQVDTQAFKDLLISPQLANTSYFIKYQQTFDFQHNKQPILSTVDMAYLLPKDEHPKQTFQQYVQSFKHQSFVKKNIPKCYKNKQKMTIFGTNIDIGEAQQIHNFMQKIIPPQYFFKHQENLLFHYYEEKTPGIAFPQLYLKYSKNYTPLHQQTDSLRSVNINIGPGVAHWYYIEPQNNKKFEQFCAQKGMTLPLNELRIWIFPSSELLHAQIPLKYKRQKKGDLIVTHPGTYHWVRCEGMCMHYTYNIFHMTQQQLKFSIQKKERVVETIKMNPEFRDLSGTEQFLPFKTVLIRYALNQERIKSKVASFMLKIFAEWYQTERELMKNLRNQNGLLMLRSSGDRTFFCQQCGREVFWFFMIINNILFCMECSTKMEEMQSEKMQSEKVQSEKMQIEEKENRDDQSKKQEGEKMQSEEEQENRDDQSKKQESEKNQSEEEQENRDDQSKKQESEKIQEKKPEQFEKTVLFCKRNEQKLFYFIIQNLQKQTMNERKNNLIVEEEQEQKQEQEQEQEQDQEQKQEKWQKTKSEIQLEKKRRTRERRQQKVPKVIRQTVSTEELKERVRQLFLQGYTHRQIEVELNVRRSFISRSLNKK